MYFFWQFCALLALLYLVRWQLMLAFILALDSYMYLKFSLEATKNGH